MKLLRDVVLKYLSYRSIMCQAASRIVRNRNRISAGLALFVALICAGALYAQEPVGPKAPEIELEEAVKNPSAQCLQPPPMVRLQDYDGPL
jgi:hypothetical protein